MMDLAETFASDNVFMFAVLATASLAWLVGRLGRQWGKTRRLEMRLAFKLALLERGMSPADIDLLTGHIGDSAAPARFDRDEAPQSRAHSRA